MSRQIGWFLLCCLLWMAHGPAIGVSVKTWTISTGDGFADGTLNGTAVDGQGRVRLAPTLETLWGPSDGIVWAVQPAGDDGAFVALSGPGRLLRVVAGLPEVTLYEAPGESLITSMTLDGADNVLIALAPEGQVWRVGAAGGATMVAETEALFVWAMAREPDGTLWMGTGQPGRVLRHRADGELETIFDSGDDPVRSLALLPGGGVVVGTGGRGRVIRIDSTDRAFVLYDADETEIVSVAVVDDGTIFALAANGQKQPTRPADRREEAPQVEGGAMRVTVRPPGDNGDESRAEPPEPKQPPRPTEQRFKSPPGGALYRLDLDGSTRRIWDAGIEMPFALVAAAAAEIYVATGDKGRIWKLDDEGLASLMLRIPSNQASTMVSTADGRLLVGGTTDARVEILGAGARDTGSYLSPPVGAGTVADWGRVRWSTEEPTGSKVRLWARSGNSDDPDDTWSEWVALGGGPGGEGTTAEVPAAAWYQLRADLSSKKGESPLLTSLEVRYLPRNRAPEISELQVELPGVVWLRGPVQSSTRTGPLVADDPVSRDVTSTLSRNRRPAGALRKGYEAGARTFSWKAEDPDGDRLRYTLEIRRENEDSWFPIATALTESFYSWDARALQDGRFRVRLTADDSRDNTAEHHRSAQRISKLFEVDNTRPLVDSFDLQRTDKGWLVRFAGRDPGGSIVAAQISVDGEAWASILPVDGVADSAEERFEYSLDDGADESRALHVRVTDAAGNQGGTMWAVPGQRD
jgi:sugar lactone lactonase YvrE